MIFPDGIKFPFFTMQQLNLDWFMQKVKTILKFMPIDSGDPGDVLQRNADGASWQPLGAAALDIDGMTSLSPVDSLDEVPVYDVSAQENKKTTVGDIVALASSAVTSVNGLTGSVVLGKSDVGLGNVDNVQQYSASNPPPYPVTSVNGQSGAVVVPTPAVDSVNGKVGTVVLNNSDVGLGNVDNVQQYSASNPPPYPVTSVNGQQGAVTISTGAIPVFNAEVPLTVTAPTGITIARSQLYGQTTVDGNFLRLRGVITIYRPTDVQYNGEQTFTVSGITVSHPAANVTLKGIGLLQETTSGETSMFSHNVYSSFAAANVDTSGNITLTLFCDYSSNANDPAQFFILPEIIPLG